MLRKLQIATAIALTVIVSAVFYYSVFDPLINRSVGKHSEEPVSDAATSTAVFIHPLTGESLNVSAEPVVAAVIFDNFNTSGVRHGLEEASVVYEALAEGDVTRLLAIFDASRAVKRFGPIRSLRPYFLDWALEYGGIIMHVGGSPQALQRVRREDDIVDIDQIGADELHFIRDESLDAPHNVFSGYTSWLQIIDRNEVVARRIRPWRYAEKRSGTNARQQIDISYSADNAVGWLWDEEQRRYLRFSNGERVLDAGGEQIGVATVIVLEVPSSVVDSVGRRTMATIGRGNAYVFTGGVLADAQWVKESPTARTLFFSENFEEVSFVPGSVWIQVVPDLTVASYSVEE